MKNITGRFLVVFLLFLCKHQGFSQSVGYEVWEPDIRKFEYADSIETYAPDAVLFAGSSSIRLWTTLSRDMAPYPVIQRGYGGAKWSDLEFYAPRIIYPHPCRAIVFFVANDITGGVDDKSPEEVLQLFVSTLAIIRDRFKDVSVFWITTNPCSSRWKAWPAIFRANNLIIRHCLAAANTYYIPTDLAFLGANGKPNDELFKEDKLHLNEKGYALWAQIIKRELDFILVNQQEQRQQQRQQQRQ
ncbi:MAG: hypothetical protein JXA72_05580 [Bacteroidales bacterium]|nr:hypothetical protein [Bacteroidales bacterium]